VKFNRLVKQPCPLPDTMFLSLSIKAQHTLTSKTFSRRQIFSKLSLSESPIMVAVFRWPQTNSKCPKTLCLLNRSSCTTCNCAPFENYADLVYNIFGQRSPDRATWLTTTDHSMSYSILLVSSRYHRDVQGNVDGCCYIQYECVMHATG
jgi:hypothetical protein